MSDIANIENHIKLSVFDEHDHPMICRVARALSVPERLQILKILLNQPRSLSEISAELDIPISSVSRHIDALADAQLIFIHYQPGLKGHAKYCSQMALSCLIDIDAPRIEDPEDFDYRIELPVGLFSHCHITAPCGMCGPESTIGKVDDPSTFFLPERTMAECIWFDQGFIDYNFPSSIKDSVEEVSFSFEICSETSYYNNNWPSDITVKINGVEVITFTSPGDFGGRRGKNTPEYWPVTSTQFGILNKFTVTDHGVYRNDVFVHKNVVLEDLNITKGNAIRLTIGIKPDAVHRGGVNLFGKNFGDFNQAIVMTIRSSRHKKTEPVRRSVCI